MDFGDPDTSAATETMPGVMTWQATGEHSTPASCKPDTVHKLQPAGQDSPILASAAVSVPAKFFPTKCKKMCFPDLVSAPSGQQSAGLGLLVHTT